MTAKLVAANRGSYRRRHPSNPTVAGSVTAQSAITDVMQQEVINVVTQALTDDDSAGQG